jgi:hypothetical protein
MTVLLTLSILLTPVAVAVAVAWAAHHSRTLRFRRDQFQVFAPMRGRLMGDGVDVPRLAHEVDAIRTRFEAQPAWPMSGALGERR